MKTCIFTSVLVVMMLMRRKHFTAVSWLTIWQPALMQPRLKATSILQK